LSNYAALAGASTSLSSRCVSFSGQRYHALCGDSLSHAGHCVCSHFHAHDGQTPPVQKVWKTQPQLGMQDQRSSALGR